jgi:hypothetical protein
VAVHADEHVGANPPHDVGDQVAEVERHRVADRVGHVDRRRARLHRGVDHAHQEVVVRARGVLRRELDVAGVLQRPLHALDRLLDDLILGRVQHRVAVDLRGRQEHVDAAARRALQRVARAADVLGVTAGQGGDDGSALLGADRVGDGLDRLVVALAGDREARLDDVDLQAVQLLGDLQLLLDVQGDAGGLLAVPQGRVEDADGRYLIGAHEVLSLRAWKKPTHSASMRSAGGPSAG